MKFGNKQKLLYHKTFNSYLNKLGDAELEIQGSEIQYVFFIDEDCLVISFQKSEVVDYICEDLSKRIDNVSIDYVEETLRDRLDYYDFYEFIANVQSKIYFNDIEVVNTYPLKKGYKVCQAEYHIPTISEFFQHIQNRILPNQKYINMRSKSIPRFNIVVQFTYRGHTWEKSFIETGYTPDLAVKSYMKKHRVRYGYNILKSQECGVELV